MTKLNRNAVSPLSLALAVGVATSAALAQNERILDTPVGWAWQYGVSSATVNGQINSGLRPFAIENVGFGQYDVVYVANSPPHQVTGAHIVYGVTATSLGNTLNSGNYRILDLAVHDNPSGTATVMTAVLVPNSGATGTPGWGWLYNTTYNQIVSWLNDNPTLRLIDLDTYTINGTQYYSAVAVHNSGNNHQPGWWHMAGATATQVAAALQANNARLIQIDLVSPGNLITPATFAAVMVSNNPGAGWFYSSLTQQQVGDLVNQNGARITAMKRYTNFQGQTRYAVAMVDNANPQTRRMRQYMGEAISNGSYGFMLRQVGGPVLCNLNSNFAYEPASVMKGLHAIYAVLQCSLNLDHLETQVYNPNRCTTQTQANLCPSPWPNCNAGDEPLEDTIKWMMQISHNARTRVIEERYGRGVLNSFADGILELDNTQINHTLGCLCGNTPNTTTASDISRMYELVNTGALFSGTWRNTLAGLMANLQAWGYASYPTLSTVINQEAAQTNLTSGEIAQFRSQVQFVNKGGRYGCGGTLYKAEGGWAEIPFKTHLLGNWVTTTRRYSFATFVHGTTDDTGSDVTYRAKEEILREQIREALESWDAACQTPGFTQHPTNKTAPVGGSTSFPTQVVGTPGTMSFQWQKQGGGGSWGNVSNVSGNISGATTATLSFSNLTMNNAGSYRVVVTAPCGTATSNAATLTVTNPVSCYPNCDGSTSIPVLNVADFSCFLTKFAAQDPYANCDGSTVPPVHNVADFSCFLSKFAAGCL
jgi:hypothetical protein